MGCRFRFASEWVYTELFAQFCLVSSIYTVLLHSFFAHFFAIFFAHSFTTFSAGLLEPL
jgi:hypothetical protein